MINPLISIIIPTYNRAEDLKRALSSIILQTEKNWEAVIIDNNSIDATDEVIYNFNEPRFKLYKISNNGLISVSRNFGLSVAKGKYIAFLDSDDWWLPNKLELSLFHLNKGFDFVYHPLYIIKNTKKFFYFNKTSDRKLSKDVFADLLKNGNGISNSSVVVVKNLIDKCWPLPEEKLLNPICDYHWWLTISKISNNFFFIDKVLGFYWYGGGNTFIPLNIINSFKKFDEIYNKNFQPPWQTFLIGKSYYRLNNFIDANKNFIQTIKNGSFSFKIKSLIFLLLIKIKKNK
jgi:glycosyltransferase involved in cell wall biosynthesis